MNIIQSVERLNIALEKQAKILAELTAMLKDQA